MRGLHHHFEKFWMFAMIRIISKIKTYLTYGIVNISGIFFENLSKIILKTNKSKTNTKVIHVTAVKTYLKSLSYFEYKQTNKLIHVTI